MLFRNINVYLYTHMHAKTITEIRGYEFEKEWEGYIRGLGGKKGKGNFSYYNCKSKVSKTKIVV